MIDKIIEFADKNAKSVIVALLGIIAAGGISGGLYIKNLQDSLKLKDDLIKIRIQAINDRYGNELQNQSKRITLLKNQVEILRKDLPRIREAVDILNTEIRKLYEKESSGVKNFGEKILDRMNELSKTTNKLDDNLRDADKLLQFARDLIPPPQPSPPGARPPSLMVSIIPVLIILIISIWSSIFYLIGKKRGKKISKINN